MSEVPLYPPPVVPWRSSQRQVLPRLGPRSVAVAPLLLQVAERRREAQRAREVCGDALTLGSRGAERLQPLREHRDASGLAVMHRHENVEELDLSVGERRARLERARRRQQHLLQAQGERPGHLGRRRLVTPLLVIHDHLLVPGQVLSRLVQVVRGHGFEGRLPRHPELPGQEAQDGAGLACRRGARDAQARDRREQAVGGSAAPLECVGLVLVAGDGKRAVRGAGLCQQ
mmetsp:Transcript_27024/g.62788  ORF Transcript_27024/g.62788 Transcript_27024/m.62788 type:complete len:230 (-) Transcript_27024:256-945(-)